MPATAIDLGPYDRAEFIRDGGVVDVELGMPAAWEELARSMGEAVPAPVRLRALVDTGADQTYVDLDWAEEYGLQSEHSVPVRMVDSQAQCPVFTVRIRLPDLDVHIPAASEYPVIGRRIQTRGPRVLIGRALLSAANLRFTCDGAARTYRLEHVGR